MDDIFVRFLSGMPPSVRGTVCLDGDGNYNMYLNAALDRETLRRTYLHELRHIRHGDLWKDGDIDEMEVAAYGEG